MMEHLTKLLIGGALASGVAMFASSAVTTATMVAQVADQTPEGESTASTMSKLVDARPELAAVLMVVSMFLAYLVASNREAKKERAAALAAQAAKEESERKSREEKEKEDREFREKMAAECHGISLEQHSKTAEVTQAVLVHSERLAAVTRDCAIDRNAVLDALKENTASNQELRDAFNRSQGGLTQP